MVVAAGAAEQAASIRVKIIVARTKKYFFQPVFILPIAVRSYHSNALTPV
jgi:hypothetical protein